MQEIERKKVDVGDLKLGMYVAELDRPWLGTPFLFQGFPLTSAEEIERLRACCRYVYIDVTKSKLWAPGERRVRHDYESAWVEYAAEEGAGSREHHFPTQRLNVTPTVRNYPPQDARGFVTTLAAVKQVHHRTHDYISKVLNDVRLGHSIDAKGARELVNAMVDTIVVDENALVWLSQLKSRDEYTTLHSINVCIISLLFGCHLGYSEAQLREIGHGALLHDLGKMKIPLALLNKTDDLTPEELAQMKQHPTYGYELLKDSKDISPAGLDIVRSHHERFDGSGYPRGLHGDEISEYALLVSIADVYDAITSDRVYHMGISPHEALNLMYSWAPSSFPQELLEEFIKCLGIYPIGSIVELNTGEVGIVMTVNRARHLRPIVMLVLDAERRPYPEHKLINLDLYDEEYNPVNIRKILESNAYGIDVRSMVLESHPELATE